MKHKIFLSLLIGLLAVTTRVSALDTDSLKVAADSSYVQGNFDVAVKQYARLDPTAVVCYNMGNCYYRLDDMARAILWYERAAQLDPSDKDIRQNLEMARTKTIDKVIPKHEFFLFSWWRSLVNVLNQDEWGGLSLACFALLLVALGLGLFLRDERWRRLSLALSALFLALTVVGNVCAFSQRSLADAHTGAIVMAPSAVVKSTPSPSGSDLFVLHEGTKVIITDNTLRDWCEVELADGKVGWIDTKSIETI